MEGWQVSGRLQANGKTREDCLPVRDERDFAIAKSYEGIADYLLLDTWKSEEPEIGACGLVHDWAVSRGL